MAATVAMFMAGIIACGQRPGLSNANARAKGSPGKTAKLKFACMLEPASRALDGKFFMTILGPVPIFVNHDRHFKSYFFV